MRVVVLSNISRELPGWQEGFAILRDSGIEVVDLGREVAQSAAPPLEQIRDADALLVGLNPIGRAVMEAVPRLRVIARPGIGVDNIDLTAATERGIPVCNTPGSNADSVADHTIALVLALLRNLPDLDRRVRAGQGWIGGPFVPAQLTGKRLAIIGTGNVGKGVARRAHGFGVTLVGYDPYPDNRFASEIGLTYLPFPDVLRGADVVTVHAPLLDETRAMFGASELAMLNPHAILVAISRGGVVDEEALAAALREGRLGGAGVDVWEKEPCAESPLFALPNTILTPHVAGFSPEAARRARVMTAENLVAALGGNPVNVVNPGALSRRKA